MSKLNSKIKNLLKIILRVPEIKITPRIVTLAPNHLLDGRTALITGGTSGIGFNIAKAFIESGSKVIITGRTESKINDAVSKLRELPNATAYGIVMDNCKVDSFHSKLLQVLNYDGINQIDILVNNAGVLTYDTISNENEKKYDEVLDTNLKGTFFLCQLFGHYMINNQIKGNILNIASSSSLRPASTAYTISKWGIRGLTLGLAKMLSPHNITVNGLAPGQTLTKMSKFADPNNIHNGNVPLGRYILPEEIANMAVVLVSDMGKSILGDIVYMTGGAGILSYEDVPYNF